MADEKKGPAFGRPKDWDKMTPEQRREWALVLVRAATGRTEDEGRPHALGVAGCGPPRA